MGGIESFGLAVLVAALAGIAAVLSSRASERLRIPAPAFFLIAAALASDIWPWLGRLSYTSVEQVVTVALAVILFDGGMRMGWDRFRSAAAASVWIGVAGTIVTAAGVAAAAHVLFSFGWHAALLIGTALAPTDPAVVFSVLGRREIAGRSGVLLEGEAGANDPVGIALLIALLGTTGTGVSTAGQVAVVFVVQMAVGVAVGAAGGRALLAFMRRVPLPSEGLYTLRVLAGALVIYGLAAVAHGSGFLAVFIAGILIGDERAPYKGEIAHFHSALASLAENCRLRDAGPDHPALRPAAGGRMADRPGPGRLAGLCDPAAAGGPAAVAGPAAAQRAPVRLVGRPQRRGTDPARRVHRRCPGQGRAGHLRDHLRRRGVLGDRAGRDSPGAQISGNRFSAVP